MMPTPMTVKRLAYRDKKTAQPSKEQLKAGKVRKRIEELLEQKALTKLHEL
ncbi:hypothetical protein [Vibrio owensii]|uniref:hypothetical protein n=1 Tax=Vibrio owensii TaxID=696485 RepID=UPI00406785F3